MHYKKNYTDFFYYSWTTNSYIQSIIKEITLRINKSQWKLTQMKDSSITVFINAHSFHTSLRMAFYLRFTLAFRILFLSYKVIFRYLYFFSPNTFLYLFQQWCCHWNLSGSILIKTICIYCLKNLTYPNVK